MSEGSCSLPPDDGLRPPGLRTKVELWCFRSMKEASRSLCSLIKDKVKLGRLITQLLTCPVCFFCPSASHDPVSMCHVTRHHDGPQCLTQILLATPLSQFPEGGGSSGSSLTLQHIPHDLCLHNSLRGERWKPLAPRQHHCQCAFSPKRCATCCLLVLFISVNRQH